jgi:hypothetical protein
VKVKELIACLKNFDKESEVVIHHDDHEYTAVNYIERIKVTSFPRERSSKKWFEQMEGSTLEVTELSSRE